MIVILHNIRSMHNVGSIFRTSDGAGCVEKIYVSGITPAPIDQYGRERSQLSKVSLGAEKTIPWEKIGPDQYHEATWEQETTQQTHALIDRLINEGFQILAIEQSPHSVPHTSIALARSQLDKIALVVGHERDGIPDTILNQCHTIIEIPMRGTKKSLNVSVAFGIAIYSLV